MLGKQIFSEIPTKIDEASHLLCNRRAQSLQSCPTVCDPMDCSLPGSSRPCDSPGKDTGVVAMPSSRASFQPRDQTCISCITGGFFTLSHRGREWLLQSGYQTSLSKKLIILQSIFYLPSLKTLLSNRKKKGKIIYRATTVLTARESPSDIKFLVFPVTVKELIWIRNKKILVRGVYMKTDKCGKIKEEWAERKRHGF